MKKLIATLALAGISALAIVGTAAAANAAPRHSDFYVATIGHGWVPEDQLTADELVDLATVCQPVVIDVQVTLATGPDGSTASSGLVPLSDAPVSWINQANFDQLGLTIPSFIGPTSYSVNSDGSFSC